MRWLRRVGKRIIGPAGARVLKNPAHLRFELAHRGLTLSQNEQRLQALRDAYRGQRCFILGNGPSLAHTDLTRLAGEISIGCNGLVMLFEQTAFRPTFYCIEDPIAAQDRASELKSVGGLTKLFPYDTREWLTPDPQTIYINFWRTYWPVPQFSTDFARLVYWGSTTTYLNLQLAYYLGCQEVYLLGVDHEWKLRPDEIPDEQGLIISTGHDQNHFTQHYFAAQRRWYHPNLERIEAAYRLAKTHYEADGRRIYNATLGGALEVFPRKDYHQVTNAA